MTGVYCIENTENGKKYVGLAKNIKARWHGHRTRLRNNTHPNRHLQAAWNKYGEGAFSFYVLEEVAEVDLDDTEIKWIKRLDTFENGYNLTEGGGGQSGRHLTDEEKRHLSEINKGALNPNFGVRRSLETRRKMSEAMRGKSHGAMPQTQKDAISNGNKGKPRPWFNKPVLWIETGRVYASISEAAEKTGYKLPAISQVCRGDRNSLYSQHFVFVEETT